MPRKIYREYTNDNTGTPYYENINTGTTQWERPTSGYFERKNNTNRQYYESIGTGETFWGLPTTNYVQYRTNNDNRPYYVNISTGETHWGVVPNVSKETNRLTRLEKELAAAKEETERLKQQAISGKPNTRNNRKSGGPSENDPVVGKFIKMLKRGVPRPAVEQKMRMEGINVGLLNGKPSNAAPSKPMGGPMAGLLAGIAAGPKLKKVNVKNNTRKNTAKPKNTKQSAMANLAAMAQKKALERQARASMTIEERLAAEKAEKEAKKQFQPKTGFAAFAAELAKKATGITNPTNEVLNNRWDPENENTLSVASNPKARRTRRSARSRRSRRNRL